MSGNVKDTDAVRPPGFRHSTGLGPLLSCPCDVPFPLILRRTAAGWGFDYSTGQPRGFRFRFDVGLSTF